MGSLNLDMFVEPNAFRSQWTSAVLDGAHFKVANEKGDRLSSQGITKVFPHNRRLLQPCLA